MEHSKAYTAWPSMAPHKCHDAAANVACNDALQGVKGVYR